MICLAHHLSKYAWIFLHLITILLLLVLGDSKIFCCIDFCLDIHNKIQMSFVLKLILKFNSLLFCEYHRIALFFRAMQMSSIEINFQIYHQGTALTIMYFTSLQ